MGCINLYIFRIMSSTRFPCTILGSCRGYKHRLHASYCIAWDIITWASCRIRGYVKLRVAHAPRMPGMFSLPPRVSDPDTACITAPVSRTCSDAYRDRYLAVPFEVVGRENVPGIPGACTMQNFTYPVRDPLPSNKWMDVILELVSRIPSNVLQLVG